MSSQIHVKVAGDGALQIVADSFGGFIDSFSDRLSRDGVLLPGTPPVERGQQVDLTFSLEDGFTLLEAKGLVAEPKRDGLGVHFLSVEAGDELLDKIVQDRSAEGHPPFKVDEAAALSEPSPEAPSEPEPESAESAAVDPEPSKVAGILGEQSGPAFAPGMDRLTGEDEAVQERKALSEIGAGFAGTQDPLAEIGGQKSGATPPSATEPVAEPEVPPSALLEGDTEASGLESSVAAEVATSVAGAAQKDLGQLSDEDFADEIDDVLDSAFGPSPSAAEEPPTDASTRLIPTLADADFAAPAASSDSDSEPDSDDGLSAAAAAEVADLLGQDAGATELLEAEGLLPTDAPDFEIEDLAPEPPPQLGAPPSSEAELTQPAAEEPDTGEADAPVNPYEAAPEAESILKEGRDLQEEAPGDAAAEAHEEAPEKAPEEAQTSPEAFDGVLAAEELSEQTPPDSVSQLEMPSFESFDDEMPAQERRSFLRSLIPLLLLALIGVGAWRVADLVRKEFSRLEEDQTPAARVPLAEDEIVQEAPADSLLALRRLEEGPVVDLRVDPAVAPASVLENVTWSESEGGDTVVEFAGNGAISPADTALLRLDGERPRYVLKIGGMSEAYYTNQLPLRTTAVEQLRFGLHLGALRNEIHVVFDLTGAEVEVREVRLEPRRLVVVLR